MKKYILLIFSLLCLNLQSQKSFKSNFSDAEFNQLKASNSEFRNFWDVLHYNLTIEPKFEDKSISGKQIIKFKITKNTTNPVFQIDINKSINVKNIKAKFKIKETYVNGNIVFLQSKYKFKKGQIFELEMDYEGKPTIAKNAPWDGGWVFTKDNNGTAWMSAACEEIGASIWLPLKDSWEDEPDFGVKMKIITPNNLVGVGNGKLISTEKIGDKKAYTWEVKNKINTYNIIPYIGNYINFNDKYNGLKGQLNLEYYVLNDNLEKAKTHFQQVKPMLASFESWFGPYPFYEDDYKLVESPYLGMEHQSNVAYGNKYKNGYLGSDLSGTGHGLSWDFIIIHESGHEWYGNNISAKDKSDMWIQESFTNYSEVLFIESTQNLNNANEYCIGIRKNIQNDTPIIPKANLNIEGSGDMYSKGANMIHTIRQIINDDTVFRKMLVDMNKYFYHKNISTKDMLIFMNKYVAIDLGKIFEQYLYGTKIPKLEYKIAENVLEYRFTDVVDDFSMPIRLDHENIVLDVNKDWQKTKLNNINGLKFNQNYYVIYTKIE